ncbi:hypothetical protein DEO72_LG9g822 [Vigna unguiculata]|uniref:Secreted protein n=1 Tax=Vigna unguiculata TaxID=3917 RepID=A0A4D6MWG7_VIGUN|nr:hypothetical protein DEO72_LG9g822 [Vigna unguiculata]
MSTATLTRFLLLQQAASSALGASFCSEKRETANSVSRELIPAPFSKNSRTWTLQGFRWRGRIFGAEIVKLMCVMLRLKVVLTVGVK